MRKRALLAVFVSPEYVRAHALLQGENADAFLYTLAGLFAFGIPVLASGLWGMMTGTRRLPVPSV